MVEGWEEQFERDVEVAYVSVELNVTAQLVQRSLTFGQRHVMHVQWIRAGLGSVVRVKG